MPRGCWGVILAIVGGLSLWVLGLAASYSYREFYKPTEYQYPREPYQPARDATKPVAGKEQPAAKAYDPHCQQPQGHDEADLCAQWGAVQAVSETNRLTRIGLKLGFFGFWIALLGGVFGFVGTAFLVMTFRENRRSADAAHDANRPWLQLEIIRVGDLKFSARGAALAVDVRVHNRGPSPATNVLLLAQLIPTKMPMIGDIRTGIAVRAIRRIFEATNNEIGGTIVFPETTPFEQLNAIANRDEIFAAETGDGAIYELGLGVRYQFGTRVGQTVYSFTVTDNASPRREIRSAEDIESHRIKLVDTSAGYAA